MSNKDLANKFKNSLQKQNVGVVQVGQPAAQVLEVVAERQLALHEQLEERVELALGPFVDFEVAVVVEVADATVFGVARCKDVLGGRAGTVCAAEVRLQQTRMRQSVAERGAHPFDHR